ncbi:HLA class I histocompatibility antigen, alpha chain G-like [Gracilinanus agilis]|uniref:HLA class I histocompatibility antigen, alpha chain G-like n=1 Tax=Gracilinanus agilis TaxID=191870 RepID=UPI001CFEDCB5|nr:HLA class I histocompatibility antigen, alpha chain G-like [Gracilinanus agilis]
MESIVFFPLLLEIVVLPEIKAAFHSLRYFQTSMSLPGRKPRFFSVGYVDDLQFVRFDGDSPSLREEPRAPWMDKMDQDYWEKNSRISRETAQTFEMGLQNLRVYYNQSEGGLHTYQRLVGCEVSRNGIFRRGFEQFAYDGLDYISLDSETLSWRAADSVALNSKHKWEAEPIIAQRQKAYLEKKCVQWLHKYLESGKETLLRAGPPSVRVTHHVSHEGKVMLRCWAQDFYPADISLIWLRDGEEQFQDIEFIETRPGGDDTFQKWIAVGVTSGQEGKYTCLVQHKGLPEPLTLKWEPQASFIWIIVGVIAVFLSAVIAGVVIWKKLNLGRDHWKVDNSGTTFRQQAKIVHRSQMSPTAAEREILCGIVQKTQGYSSLQFLSCSC